MKKTLAVVAAFSVATVAYGQLVPREMNISSGDIFSGTFSDDSSWNATGMTFEAGLFTGAEPSYNAGSRTVDGDWSWTALPADPNAQADWAAVGDDGFFDAVFSFQHNEDPFTAGTQGYIWGFNNDEVGGGTEWVLFTNTDWTLPTVSETPDATEVVWALTDDGTEVVGGFGIFDQGGREITSVEVIPEPSTYALFFGLGILGFLGYRRFRK